MINLETYLRIRPLEAKYKLKQDYYTIHQNGLSNDLKNADLPASVTQTTKPVLAVMGHPLAWAQPPANQAKLRQAFFPFDRIYSQDTTNAAFYNECVGPLMRKTLNEEGASSLILGFGHHHSGKTNSIIGHNNHQLQKSLGDVPIAQANDSRGSVMRCLCDIKDRDPGAKVTLSFIDLVMDNIRDLVKHVKKQNIKTQSVLAVNFADKVFNSKDQKEERPASQQAFHRMSEEEKAFQKQIIEREYLSLQESQNPLTCRSQYTIKNMTEHPIDLKDLSETAYLIDKCHDQSHHLNEKMGFINAIRHMQMVTIKITLSQNTKFGKPGTSSTLVFADLGDYDKISPNVIDHQKVYEMVLVNNAMTALSQFLAGVKSGQYTLDNAPYEKSKLTTLLKALVSSTNCKKLNLALLCNIWPTEACYQDVMHTLSYFDRFIKLDDPSNAYNQMHNKMTLSAKEVQLQNLAKENLHMKTSIDSFRRSHQAKLNMIKEQLGINTTFQQFEAIIKAKPGTREYHYAKERKDFVEKTENLMRLNKETEDKIKAIKANMQDDIEARKQVQENFSQRLYYVKRRIEKLREEFKVTEQHLSNAQKEQLYIKNEELQKVLDNTHAQLLENQGLVEHIIQDQGAALSQLPIEAGRRTIHGQPLSATAVIKQPLATLSPSQQPLTVQLNHQGKTITPNTNNLILSTTSGRQGTGHGRSSLATATMKALPQHINMTKEESRKLAEDHYERLLAKQCQEQENQLKALVEQYEDVLRRKGEELTKAAETFKQVHEKLKSNQNKARVEIVKVFNMAQKQDQLLQNIENGMYCSAATKRLQFNEFDRPIQPDPSDFKFLEKALEKVSLSSTSSSSASLSRSIKKASPKKTKVSVPPINNLEDILQHLEGGSQVNQSELGESQAAAHTSINKALDKSTVSQHQASIKDADSFVNADQLRSYVKEIMLNIETNHAQSHPAILKGEHVDNIVRETDKYKKQCEVTERKTQELKMQTEKHRRLIERVGSANNGFSSKGSFVGFQQ